jgi:hypothetical protein
MRLHPAVTEEEAMSWLLTQVKASDVQINEEAMSWLLAQAKDKSLKTPEEQLKEILKPVAESMAAVSAVVLPEGVAPLFP